MPTPVRPRRLIDEQAGSATIEFVVWMFLLAVWLVFSTAIFIAWDNRANVAKAAYTISDIVSRRETVDSGFLTQIDLLNGRLVSATGEGSETRISSIIFDGGTYDDDVYVGGAFRVEWSCGSGALDPLEDDDIPVELIPPMSPLDTIVLTETYVNYTPISVIGGLAPLKWENRLVIRPRIVRSVALEGECPVKPDGGGDGDGGGGERDS